MKAELRENLLARLRERRPVFEGILGYDESVLPQVQNALLSGHDFILLGLRGQAKTRILRALAALLDEALPAVAGSELREDPFAPITEATRRRIAAEGDELAIEWVPRAERYHEKLATPDVTIADLIGDIDPIKAARGKLSFADPEVIHYGILPRSNRGIFAINELPDLQARIQVGLLNILEEGDVQIRGFPLRLPLDVLLVFSANPEDYTSRGRIITPLRDRISSQILTHYPRTLEIARAITDQEARLEREGQVEVAIPEWLRDAIEEVSIQARASELVDQNSGVSARVGIALIENVVSNAERRAILRGEGRATARVADLYGASAAVTGKIELVYEGEREGAHKVALHLIGKALKAVFDRSFPDAYAVTKKKGGAELERGEYDQLLAFFQQGGVLDVSDALSDGELLALLDAVPGLRALSERYLEPQGEAQSAAAMELVLEGLHHSSLLARDQLVGGRVYKDMFQEMVKGLKG